MTPPTYLKKPTQKYPILWLTTLLLIGFQILWHFYMHQPYRSTDITIETVQTILQDGFFTSLNPMTGQSYTIGVPLRWKILLLPYLYAGICKLTQIPPQIIIYGVVPTLVLAGSYCIYHKIGKYLFPDHRRKQILFLLFTVLIYQFGNYGPVTDSFRLFHMGYEGTSIRAVILLPLALLCCLKGNWRRAVLCAVLETCIVWTLYGLGYVVFMMFVFGMIRLILQIRDRRRKTA